MKEICAGRGSATITADRSTAFNPPTVRLRAHYHKTFFSENFIPLKKGTESISRGTDVFRENSIFLVKFRTSSESTRFDKCPITPWCFVWSSTWFMVSPNGKAHCQQAAVASHLFLYFFFFLTRTVNLLSYRSGFKATGRKKIHTAEIKAPGASSFNRMKWILRI